MRYLGGKSRIGKEIAKTIEAHYTNEIGYIEPFVGGFNIVPALTLNIPKVCLDIDEDLIILYKAIQEGWVPPDHISEEEYTMLKGESTKSPLRSFAAFGASFGGVKWVGYARGVPAPSYDLIHNPYSVSGGSKRSLIRSYPHMLGVIFKTLDYRVIKPERALIYCDPPYANTKKFSNKSFNTPQFWGIMREWATNNTVLVSCYEYPPDFKSVWSKLKANNLSNGNIGVRAYATEYVVMYNPA